TISIIFLTNLSIIVLATINIITLTTISIITLTTISIIVLATISIITLTNISTIALTNISTIALTNTSTIALTNTSTIALTNIITIALTNISTIALTNTISACDMVIGVEKLGDTANNVDKHHGYIHIVTDDIYTVKCCGVVERWRFTAGNTGQINLQIWQPLKAADKLKLIGQNIFDVQNTEKDKTVTFDIGNSKERIAIRSGDYIGWYTEGRDIVAYKEEQRGKTKSISVKDFKVGEVVDFVSARVVDNRTYTIDIKASPGHNPSFIGLPTTIEISMDITVGKAVCKVEASDPDMDHAGALKIEMVNGPDFLYFDSNTNQIKVKRKLQVRPPSELFQIDLKVTDPCDLTGSGTVEIVVKSSDSQTTVSRSSRAESNHVRTTSWFTTTTTNPNLPEDYDDYEDEIDDTTATDRKEVPVSKPEPEFPAHTSGTAEWIIGVSVVGVVAVVVAVGLAAYETTKYRRSRRSTDPLPKKGFKGDVEDQSSGQPHIQRKLNTDEIEAFDGDVKQEQGKKKEDKLNVGKSETERETNGQVKDIKQEAKTSCSKPSKQAINDTKFDKLNAIDTDTGKQTRIENLHVQERLGYTEPNMKGKLI
ncbi:hypothetical protein CHS0354_013694, partial [Potamilus streckersoni]